MPIYHRFIVPLVLALSLSAAAQQHTRLLYHVPLTSNAPNAIGQITSYGGEFTSQGWRATSGSGQLRIDCAAALPAEGTMEVTMRGMMPTISNEWILFALHSRSAGNFDEVDPSPASYAFLKTEPKYASL
ncbi:MAG: hypothetical protein ONA69_07550, partial [candidate division KSB1 bacterium]|nr:hypothetical protein [candidate division KSB1 bacterium]